MSVPTVVFLALAITLMVGAWIAWRHLLLRRLIDRYGRSLREDARAPAPRGNIELEKLGMALRTAVAGLEAQLSELGRERDRLAAILEQMTDGVLIADAEGRVRIANPAARRFFAAPEPLGRSVVEVLRNHQLVDVWRRCQQTGLLQSETIDIPARQQYLQLVVMPDEHQQGSLLLVQDLTRVRRLETIRRDFVSNLSHELRTPLASLKALTETLQDGALSDPEAGPLFLSRIETEVDALTQMAQELLDLSRIESGQVALEFARVSPVQLLASAVDRMRLQADRAGVELRVDCRDDLPSIRADATRLEQVIVNLVHNALKFTNPGGQVVVSADLQDAGAAQATEPAVRMVRLAVSDTGIGIPADDVPRIFERFYRVDKARSGGGTGLGLSIARHVVEAHGGVIWAESIEGRGSTFYFTVPFFGGSTQ